MNVARWTGIIVAAAALGCAGQQAESKTAGGTAAAQPRDTDRGGGANATASNAEASSQRPSSGAGSLDPHPAITDPNDPRYVGKGDARSGNVDRPGLEGRTGMPQQNADSGTGSASASAAKSSAAAKSDVKELPEVRGQVNRVSQNDITIHSQDGKDVTLKRDPQTTVDGQQGGFAALHEGDQVRASYDERKGDKIAIDVRRSGSGMSGASGTSTDTTGTSTDTSGSSTSTSGTTNGTNDTSTSTGGTTGTGGTSGTGTGGDTSSVGGTR